MYNSQATHRWFENAQPFGMANDSKMKTWVPGKGHVKGTAGRMWSEDELEGLAVKPFVKT